MIHVYSCNSHLIIYGSTNIRAIYGRHECQVLPVLPLQVIEVFVTWRAIPKQTRPIIETATQKPAL